MEILKEQSSPVLVSVSEVVASPDDVVSGTVVPPVPVLEPLTLADHATIATQPTLTIRREPSPMSYIDGFLIPVSASNKETYRELARKAAELFMEFGATRVVECWGDDVPDGETHDFKRAAKVQGDEVVVFSWVEYPSKEVRDAANRKMMADPRMKAMGNPMPFDEKRMSVGGFAPILDTAGDGR